MDANVPTTKPGVIKALQEWHGYDADEAKQIADECHSTIEQGFRFRSFLYYTVDQILVQVEHECDDNCVGEPVEDED